MEVADVACCGVRGCLMTGFMLTCSSWWLEDTDGRTHGMRVTKGF